MGPLFRAAIALLMGLQALGAAAAETPITVGSKRFTESYVLGELATQSLQAAGFKAVHRQGLGNTAILAQALETGAVQLYPEYTGTLSRELLQLDGPVSPAELDAKLAERGLVIVARLGFNNSYALGMREAQAEALKLRSVSDLARLSPPQAAGLRTGLSHEFQARADGWPGLARAYGLGLQPGPGLDHGLALQALAQGQVDVIDVYTTDAQIQALGLRVLQDDRAFFPRYDAVLLARSTLSEPARQALRQALEGRLTEARMVTLNARVEVDGQPFAAVAQEFLAGQATAAQPRPSFWERLLAPDLARLLGQHLLLVVGSVLMALSLGLPLAVWASARPRLAGWVHGAVGVLQTVPSLALLALLIALLGRIGFLPALLALALYALLPIVANALAGLAGVPGGLLQAGRALGLTEWQLLRHVRLPLALPVLWAGIVTAAVVNVGTATMAAFVGAGGLGERIVAGLAVNDAAQLLAGALPAAALALVVQGLLVWIGRRFR